MAQMAYIVAETKSRRATMVLEEKITPEVALRALDRSSRYHEIEYRVGPRRIGNKTSDKIAITFQARRNIKEIPAIVLHDIKEIANSLQASLRHTDDELLNMLQKAFAPS